MDYVPEASVQAYIASAVKKCLDGIADARQPNHLVLNPDKLVLDFVILFDQNTVETEATDTPVETLDTMTDTPGVTTETSTVTDSGRTDTETTTPPSRTTVTARAGQDLTETDRNYEDFED